MSTPLTKRLLVQGATGSIGTSTLDVVRAHADRFSVVGIAARANVEALLSIAREFHPQSIALEDSTRAKALSEFARNNGRPTLYVGAGAALAQVSDAKYDLLVNAQLGSAGLEPTLSALKRGISVALANKETLVAAGPLVMKAASQHGASVIPIDSEHSAILQCLIGESRDSIRKIWLTTSGGPFWGRPHSSLSSVTVEQALAHPTWKMGAKITIDSSTLFNKGLEVIETSRLFDVTPEQIGVVVHRQSIVHSMVEFNDGSIKAQLSRPDMKLPILYALSYPERIPSDVVRTSIESVGTLSFEPVPGQAFPCLDFAFEALRIGGTAPAAISAADEIAVDAFLNRHIRFTDISETIGEVLREWPGEELTDVATVRRADTRAREMADNLVNRRRVLSETAKCC
jgi:1-deoxy-D-xylulose-5-phosphate reductoisomerase